MNYSSTKIKIYTVVISLVYTKNPLIELNERILYNRFKILIF